MLDDFLMIVMRGSQTVAEETMVEAGRENLVREFREQFENEMTTRLVGMIEESPDARSSATRARSSSRPTSSVELFFFDPPAEETETAATARGQLEDGAIGEAREGAHADDVGGDVQADSGDSGTHG